MKDLAVSFYIASTRYAEIPGQEASWLLDRVGSWVKEPVQVFGDRYSGTLSRGELDNYISEVVGTSVDRLLESHTFVGLQRYLAPAPRDKRSKSSIYSPEGITWTHGVQLSYPDKISMLEIYDKDIRFDPMSRRWGRTYRHLRKTMTHRYYREDSLCMVAEDVGFLEPVRTPDLMRLALSTMLLHRVLTTNIEEYLVSRKLLLPEEFVDVLVNGIRDGRYSLKDTEYKVYEDKKLRYIIKHCRTSKLITCWTASAWYDSKKALRALATGKECKYNFIYDMHVKGQPVCIKK